MALDEIADRRGIPAEQDDLADPSRALAQGPAEGPEVGALSVAPHDEDQGDLEAVDRRDGRADVRALGIVVPACAVRTAYRLATVREPGERAERVLDRAAGDSHLVRDRHRREGVERVVTAGERESADFQPPFGPPGKPGASAVLDEAVLSLPGAVRGIRDGALAIAGEADAEGRDPLVVTPQHGRARSAEDSRLGRAVRLEPLVAVEVIGTHVEKGRDARTQGPGRLELEARELHDVEVRVAREERKGRRAEVSTDGRIPAVRLRHGVHEGADRALAVRARHPHDRGAGRAGKQLDLAEHRDAALGPPPPPRNRAATPRG